MKSVFFSPRTFQSSDNNLFRDGGRHARHHPRILHAKVIKLQLMVGDEVAKLRGRFFWGQVENRFELQFFKEREVELVGLSGPIQTLLDMAKVLRGRKNRKVRW